jgi:hypothetical protein
MTIFQIISTIIAGFFTLYYLPTLVRETYNGLNALQAITWIVSIIVAIVSFVGVQ